MFKPTPTSAIPPWGIEQEVQVAVRYIGGRIIARTADGTAIQMKINRQHVVTAYRVGEMTLDEFQSLGGAVTYRTLVAVRLQSGRLDWDATQLVGPLRSFIDREMSKRDHPSAQKRARFRERKAGR